MRSPHCVRLVVAARGACDAWRCRASLAPDADARSRARRERRARSRRSARSSASGDPARCRCCRRCSTATCRPSATSRSCSSRATRPPTLLTGKAVDAGARRRSTTSSSTTACAASSRRRIAALQARRRPIARRASPPRRSCRAAPTRPCCRRSQRALAKETDPEIKALLTLTQASIQLASTDKADAARRDPRARARAAIRTPRRCCWPLLEKKGGRVRRARRATSAPRPSSRCARSRAGSATGELVGARLQRHQPRQHPAARGARPRDHLRPDGRHQHGARRADHDRRVRDLRRAEPVPQLPARRVRLVPASRRCRSRSRSAALVGMVLERTRDPLPVRPAARDAARDLGHQPDPDPGGAHDLRRAERAGRESVVDVGRRRGRSPNVVLPWSRIVIIVLRGRRAAR